MSKQERTKLFHEGSYVAEVDVELLKFRLGAQWSPRKVFDEKRIHGDN